jgi:hypothetical protein
LDGFGLEVSDDILGILASCGTDIAALPEAERVNG